MTEIRNGYVATFHGREYEARPAEDGTVRLYSPDPVSGFTQLAEGRHLRVARERDLEALRYVRTVGVWKGARFAVIGSHGSWLRVECLEPDEAVATALGLERFDLGVFQGWAPRSEVTELREQHL